MRVRRDPRAERRARLIAGGERPRFALVAPAQPPTGRPRRDPRALRRAATVSGGARPRIDWHRTGSATSVRQAPPDAPVAAEPSIRIIAEPAFLVLAIPDHAGGALSEHDRELIGAARQLADAGGGAVVVLTAGEIADLGSTGADRTVALPAGLLAEFDPEARAAAVLAAADMLKPRHVLFPESQQGGADLARRVSALSGERLFGGVEAISPGRLSRRMRGGAMEMSGPAPFLISIVEGASAAHEGPPHEARRLDAPEFAITRRIGKAAPLKVEASALPLADADFILSGGNGVTDWAGFASLGQMLGATLGGSRVVCDEGHLPRDRQVGASGSVVTARCYLAFGIAGAPQHLQGITGVSHVVAVNTDLHAEMIKRADLAIIADAQTVMPALIAHARSAAPPLDEKADDASSVSQHDGSPPLPSGEGGGEGLRTIDSALPLTLVPLPMGEGTGGADRTKSQTTRHGARLSSQRQAKQSPLNRGSSASVAVLLSIGRHPASGRARRAPLDARALELALNLAGAEIHAVHACDPGEAALRDYLGMGLERLTVLDVAPGGDPVPALSAYLAERAPQLVLCGSRAEGAEDSGMVPYLIARAIGAAMITDVAAISVEGGRASLIQALPRGKRRLVETQLPVVAAVNAAAPAPRQSAFAAARRGIIDVLAAEAAPDALLNECEIRPWRPRPKRMRVAASASAADRLKAMTETRSGEGAVMIDPTPEDAARAIYNYLLEKRIIDERG